MTTAVCMAIYNGEKFIEEQLYSILEQTKKPDEVILVDDGSEDLTVQIVKQFISRHQLNDNWKLYENKENKGYPANFYYAMSLCTKQVVFLADQDDIWDKHKIAYMCDSLLKHPEAQAICCKFGLIDADGRAIKTVMQPTRSRDTATCKRIDIKQVFYKCEWPGMVVAYRNMWYNNKLRDIKVETSQINVPHDFLVCAWAAEGNGFLQLDIELAYHRRHDSNTGGEEHKVAKLLNRERKLSEIAKYNGILQEFKNNHLLSEVKALETLEEKLKVMNARYKALEEKAFWDVICNALKYRGWNRMATMIGDLLICLGV